MSRVIPPKLTLFLGHPQSLEPGAGALAAATGPKGKVMRWTSIWHRDSEPEALAQTSMDPGHATGAGGMWHRFTCVKTAAMNDWHTGLVLLRNVDSLPQALPMVQAILQMTRIISIPLVTVLPAYSIRTGQHRQCEFTGRFLAGRQNEQKIAILIVFYYQKMQVR